MIAIIGTAFAVLFGGTAFNLYLYKKYLSRSNFY